MAIEHYSSLASNRNYKIHNASDRAATPRPSSYVHRNAARDANTKTTSTNKITPLFTTGKLFTIMDTKKTLLDYS